MASSRHQCSWVGYSSIILDAFLNTLTLVWLCRVPFAACGVFTAAQSARAQQLWPRASLPHHRQGRSSPTRDQTRASCTARQFLTAGPPGKSLPFPVERRVFLSGSVYWSAQAIITTYHKRGGLNNRNSSVFSQFWRVEAWLQGVSRAGFSQGFSPWLVDGHAFSLCPPIAFPLCVCPNLLKGHQSHWIRAHSNDLIFTVYLFKDPISK